MKETANFLAVDLGASNGRVLLARWDGAQFNLEELHRFSNGPVKVLGHIYWDVLRIWSEILTGLARYAALSDRPLSGIGVDTWGVDFALLDRAGRLLGNPFHYRDARTDGMPERVFQKAPANKIYKRTGIQFMQINTLFQLYSMVATGDPQLEAAEILLMAPDLFHYWLTGEKACEYTIATTSQMLACWEGRWASDLLDEIGIPTSFLPKIIPPGTYLGQLRAELLPEVGLSQPVPVIAPGSHDTASAVASVPELDAKSVYISSGTWSLIGVEIPEPIVSDRALKLNFTNEGGVNNTIRLLRNMTGLWLLDESRRYWQTRGLRYDWDELLTLAEQAEPFHSLIDPDSADFLSPGDMPVKIQDFCRQSGQAEPTSVGEVARCCLESLALKSRWVLEALETLTAQRYNVIRVVGGGSLNHLLCQFTADACQRLVVAGPVEATALGNIMIQAIASGHLSSLAEGRQAIGASFERRLYEPRPGTAWQDAYARFTRLLE